MYDLRSRLDRFAERGEHRGAAVVYRRAIQQKDEAPKQAVLISLPPPDRVGIGRWRKVAVAVVVVAAVVAVVVVVANRAGPQHVIVAPRATTKQALATQSSAKLVWVDGRAVVEGDPKTGRQVRLSTASGACQTCSGVRMGRYLFLTQPRILRVDTYDGRVDDLGPGLFVFPHPDGTSLYVVLSEEATATTTTTTIARVDVNGHRLGGPWTLPAGQVLVSPPRAVVGGVLTQTNENGADHTLSVWDPTTGRVSRVGPSRDVIDTFTARGATSSVIAYTAAGCRTTGCGLMITRVPGGSTRRIAAPDGAPGFIGGGSFSPDGEQLAVFVDRVPERDNPGGELVIVTLATGAATPIIGSTVGFGEPFGFATWSPDGNWVYFGGLSNRLMAHYRDASDAVPLTLPAYYSVVAIAPNSTISPTLPSTATDNTRLTRPITTMKGCVPAWADQGTGTVKLFSLPNPNRTVQVLANPARGITGPYAIVERFVANSGQLGTPNPVFVSINGRRASFYVGTYGQGNVVWTLADGSQAYIRTRGFDQTDLVAIARALQPRMTSSPIPGFDLTRPAPLGLAVIGETAGPVHGTSESSGCTLANGADLNISALHGDTVFRYGVAMDWLPLPVVTERGDTTVMVVGPPAAARKASQSIHNASIQQWAALLRHKQPVP